MITKTTKQIVKEYLILKEMSDNKLGGQSKNDFQEDLNNKVWVGLDELKKEIENIIDEIQDPEFISKFGKTYDERVALHKFAVWVCQFRLSQFKLSLCNSQEQKSSTLQVGDATFVSCEHNTGEDKVTISSNSMSSPVHSVVASNHSEVADKSATNPKNCEWCKKDLGRCKCD